MSKRVFKPTHVDHLGDLDAIAYSDGGAVPEAGAFACVVRVRGERLEPECAAFEFGGKVGGMELSGVLSALIMTRGAGKIRIVSDSQYVINACGLWMPNWKRNGWAKKGSNKELKNVPLLKLIDHELAGRLVEFKWTPGHAGNPWNERADALCTEQIKLAKKFLDWRRA